MEPKYIQIAAEMRSCTTDDLRKEESSLVSALEEAHGLCVMVGGQLVSRQAIAVLITNFYFHRNE